MYSLSINCKAIMADHHYQDCLLEIMITIAWTRLYLRLQTMYRQCVDKLAMLHVPHTVWYRSPTTHCTLIEWACKIAGTSSVWLTSIVDSRRKYSFELRCCYFAYIKFVKSKCCLLQYSIFINNLMIAYRPMLEIQKSVNI